jgi:mannose-6-phosphate isomerase
MNNPPTLYPLLLESTLHVKVWGGRQFAEYFNRVLPTREPYGEAWELHDTSIICNGHLSGKTLGDALAIYGHDLIGAGNDPDEGFPLLAKLLDAQDWLSVQVHPNDQQAQALEGQPRGKTEAWVILQASEGSELVIGITPQTPRETVAQAIESSTLESYLVRKTVQAGDVLFIPAGTVHAIGPDILLYEIQQSSDTTYRLYDWGRMGLDGNPRPLHIEKSLAVSNLDSLPVITPHGTDGDALLIDSPYFKTYRYDLRGQAPLTIQTHHRFHALTCVQGSITLECDGHDALTWVAGTSALVPAVIGNYQLSGDGIVLCSYQPEKEHERG